MERYHVEITYSTFADSPEEALYLALGAIGLKSGASVEVIDAELDRVVWQTDLADLYGEEVDA